MKENLFAAMVVAGLAGLFYGIWLLSRPGAFIVGGLTLALCGFFASYDSLRARHK